MCSQAKFLNLGSDWLLFRGGVVGQFVVGFVGALDGYVVEEERGGEDGFGDFSCVVGDPEVLACGDDSGAEGALVEVVENGSADEGALAIEVDAVEQAGCVFCTEGLDVVDGLEAAVFGNLDESGGEFSRRE